MGSRLRDNPSRIFQCFLEVVAPTDGNEPWILQKFPDHFNCEEVLKSVGEFAYPCDTFCPTVQHFSFVLTDVDSKWTYGFCRHTPNTPTCFCILSYLPWHEAFFKLLDKIADITHNKNDSNLIPFLESVYNNDVPLPGTNLSINCETGNSFDAFCPNHLKLPTLPEHRNLAEYTNAINLHNMVVIFASMLNERRIIICDDKLSRLSACVQAASILIYPMHWQHIFIPVLPMGLRDYLSAPIPFLIGVPKQVFERVKRFEIGDAVVLYADSDRIETPFEDLQNLPVDIVNNLKRKLKMQETMPGDGVARAFLDALVELIGGYRDALKFNGGTKITFCQDTFIQTRHTHIQPYLEKMLHLQIFQQFIEERLEMLNDGKGLNDVFEETVSYYAGKGSAKFRMQYKEWMGNFRKESGAILKSVKSKAYPAVKQMKDRSRKAYKDMRSMFQDNFSKDSKYTTCATVVGIPQSSSAPSSPTSSRPNTVHGSRLSRATGSQRPVVSYVRQRDGPTRRTVCGRLESPRKFKNYTPLGVESVSADVSNERSPSPELVVQPLNIDLMDDLKEFFPLYQVDGNDNNSLLNRNVRSTNSVPVIDRTLKPQQSSQFDSNLFFDGHWHKLTPPLPPPRSKRPVMHSHKVKENIDFETSDDSISTDISLIRLDSDDSEIFDPLLITNERNEECFSAHNVVSTEDLLMTQPLTNVLFSQTDSISSHNPAYFQVLPTINPSSINGSGVRPQISPLQPMPNRFSLDRNNISNPMLKGNVLAEKNCLKFPILTNIVNQNNNFPFTTPLIPTLNTTPSAHRLQFRQPDNLSNVPVSLPLESPCRESIVFDSITNDFLLHESRPSSSSPSTSINAEEKQWQTFE